LAAEVRSFLVLFVGPSQPFLQFHHPFFHAVPNFSFSPPTGCFGFLLLLFFRAGGRPLPARVVSPFLPLNLEVVVFFPHVPLLFFFHPSDCFFCSRWPPLPGARDIWPSTAGRFFPFFFYLPPPLRGNFFPLSPLFPFTETLFFEHASRHARLREGPLPVRKHAGAGFLLPTDL